MNSVEVMYLQKKRYVRRSIDDDVVCVCVCVVAKFVSVVWMSTIEIICKHMCILFVRYQEIKEC